MAASAINTVKNTTENTMIEGKIIGEEKKIKTLTAEIGNLILLRLDAGEQMGPGIMERYAAIESARKEIKAATAEMPKAKATCAVCSAKTVPGMQYCGVCGAPLKA